jgi:hypothetical protein
MLKLLVFAPCEKVIINSDENTSTLITILESVNTPMIPDEENLPVDVVVPFRWYAYALWSVEAEADYGPYEQRVKLLYPDNDGEGLETVLEFTCEPPNRNHRTTIFYPGFPLTPAGTAYVKIELRKRVEDAGWEDIARFPIVINRPDPPLPAEP